MNKRGFTLVEIVMILVLLGILAAVAVPKYFDLKSKAELQTAKAVAAEYQARINGKFAEVILQGENCSFSRTTAITTANSELRNGDEFKAHGFTFVQRPLPTDFGLKVIQLKKGNVTFPEYTISLPECAEEDHMH